MYFCNVEFDEDNWFVNEFRILGFTGEWNVYEKTGEFVECFESLESAIRFCHKRKGGIRPEVSRKPFYHSDGE